MAIQDGDKPIRYFQIWKDVEGEVRVLGCGGMFTLNRLASAIWRLLDGELTVRELTDRLSAGYPSVSRTQIANDLRGLLERMESDDLIICNYDPLFPYKPALAMLERLGQQS